MSTNYVFNLDDTAPLLFQESRLSMTSLSRTVPNLTVGRSAQVTYFQPFANSSSYDRPKTTGYLLPSLFPRRAHNLPTVLDN
jgi:hypothetical protein